MMPTSVFSLARLMPSETTRSASTSRPESVSSRTAMPGLSNCICRISWRFFSPPENPSLTLRSAKTGSMRRSSMEGFMSLTQWRSEGASPSMAVLAVRRKFETVTPGTSTGYCMARKRPARARSSTLISSTSTPTRVTVPLVISYLGWTATAQARVDFPEPLGPMTAWISPPLMVRSTPLRISLVPSGLSTVAWRSLISRIDICGSPRCGWLDGVVECSGGELPGRIDRDLAGGLVHPHRVDGDGQHGRQLQRPACAQVELATVLPAFDGAALDIPVGEGDVLVGADVLEGVDVPVLVAHQSDLGAADDDIDRLTRR